MLKMKKIVAVLCALGILLSLPACRKGKDDETGPASGEKQTYTVTVKAQNGLPLEQVGVYIYEDERQQELVWFNKTDADGKMTFSAAVLDSYVAVLSDIPTGYKAEEYYPLTGTQTEIVLQVGALEDADVDNLTYKLGDTVMDFTVTGPDGTEYTLSKLLEQYKAVMLNFWYIGCEPCKLEFPYLQEAYSKYSQDVAVIAMNPMDPAEDIAAFQKANGYTFPMVSCGSEWEKIMNLTAYPTTVMIDRYGNIALIHVGSIDSAKTFEDTFAHFVGETYESGAVEDITDLAGPEEEGSVSNPTQIYGTSVFEFTVEPGKEVFAEALKSLGMYFQVSGSGEYYVIYNGRSYTPDASGKVGFVITTGNTFEAPKIGIGNGSDKKQTYKVYMSHLAGTADNPYTMSLGEFTTKIPAGKEEGVYYVYTAKESGTLTVQCLSATSGIEYGYTLYNTGTMAVRTLEEDGKTDGGKPTLSVVVNKGDRVQFIPSTLPDSSNNYPAGTFKFLASFKAGAGTNTEKVELVSYSVAVSDEKGAPMVNVNFSTVVDGQTKYCATDASGVAALSLEKGTYTFTMIVPDGYRAEKTSFTLTEKAPTAKVQLQKVVIVNKDYTVKVVDPAGTPVAGVLVFIGNDLFDETDENGIASVNLPEGTYQAQLPMVPDGYVLEQSTISFPEGQTALTVTLEYAPGTANRPIEITVTPYTTERMAGYTGRYYTLKYTGAATLTLEGANGYVIYDGVTYAANEAGKLTVQLPGGEPLMTADLQIGNSASTAQSYVLSLTYGQPEGPTDPVDPTETTTEATGEAATSTEESTVEETTTEETTEETTTEETLPATTDYTVTVLGPDGKAVSGVLVQFTQGNTLKATGSTNASGQVTKNLDTGDYTVALKFSGTSYYYDKTLLTLTAYKTALTVNLAAEPDEEDVNKHWFLNNAPIYNLYEGTTHITLGTNKVYYSAENGNNCFFIFVPERSGTFRIALDNSRLELSNYGCIEPWPCFQEKASDSEDNALYISIQNDQVGNVAQMLAVSVVEGITDAAISITRVGDPAFSLSSVPYDDSWMSGYEPQPFTLNTDGKTLTYVNIRGKSEDYQAVYNEADGFYHLGAADGPILYMNLGKNAPYLQMYTMIMGDGVLDGSPFRRYFYNADGTFDRKEDYTELMRSYLGCIDATTGVYPVTKDLAYMIQNGGAKWWDTDSPEYFFVDRQGEKDFTVNTEIAWMFAVCYVE